MLDSGAMLWKRRPPPERSETAPAAPDAELVALIHRVTLLERDVADLDDRYRRRAARYRKAGIDEEAPVEVPSPHNGSAAMDEVAKRRARSWPGGGR